MLGSLRLGLSVLMLSLMLIRPGSAQGIISEITGGVLYHDIGVLGQQKEYGADLKC